jgi:hypothetical protein
MSTRSYSHFLNLPAEIRTEIYSLFFQPLIQHAKHKTQLICEDARRALGTSRLAMSLSHLHTTSTCKETSQKHSVEVKEYFQLLLVCRLIHQEAFPICYNNVTFHVRKPLEFANSFLRHVGAYKLSQIRHIEMRLEGIPVGVDGWSCSAPKLSNWNHHHVRMLFENYPELECLATLVIKIEKFADRRIARWWNFCPVFPESLDWVINSAWSQNKDTDAMKYILSHLKLGKGSQIFAHAFTVIDDDNIDERDKRSLRTADGRYSCEINMKRVFQAILWKTSER